MSDTGIRVGAAVLVTLVAGAIGLRSSTTAYPTALPPVIARVAPATAPPQSVTTADIAVSATTTTTIVLGYQIEAGAVLGFEQPPRRSWRVGS